MLEPPELKAFTGCCRCEGGGHADVLPVLQVPANTAGAVPC